MDHGQDRLTEVIEGEEVSHQVYFTLLQTLQTLRRSFGGRKEQIDNALPAVVFQSSVMYGRAILSSQVGLSCSSFWIHKPLHQAMKSAPEQANQFVLNAL